VNLLDDLFVIMFVVFLTLKLVGKITWSWWWVSAPLWMPLAIAIACLGVCLALKVAK